MAFFIFHRPFEQGVIMWGFLYGHQACMFSKKCHIFMLTCRSNGFLWHSESSSAVTLLLHVDWMMLNNSSNQGGANSVTLAPWHTKSRPQILVASKAVFLENYLAVSTWILNGSSIEWLEKKYQHFSLAGVRFGRQVNQISGLKFAWRGSELCLTLLLYNCCYKRSLRNNPRNQTNIFRLHVTLTMPRSQSCIIKSFLQGLRFKIRSTIDQWAQNTRPSCPPTLLQLNSCLLCYEICNRISRIIEWIFFMESRQVSSIVFLIKT